MIDINTLQIAMDEAERFLGRAKKLKKMINAKPPGSYNGGQESAACKRASLDLSKALAKLRHA